MNMHVATPVSGVENLCLFEVGTYARTSDGIVYIIGGGESGYLVARTEREEECFYHRDELSPWSPQPGESVVESDNEECAPGIVVSVADGTSLVKWPGFHRPQTWSIADLEPAWVD